MLDIAIVRTENGTVNARIDGNRVVCGACGGLLMLRVQGFNCIADGMEYDSKQKYAIKCKNRFRLAGHNFDCNIINTINL